MKRVGETAFLKDIVSEVSEKTGYSKEKVEANYYALLDTIKQMTKEEDVSTIYIPFLGSMYFKPLKFSHFFKNTKNRERNSLPEIHERAEKLIGELKGEGYHRHMKRSKLYNPHFTKFLDKKQLEEHQNKAYDKLKESQDYR